MATSSEGITSGADTGYRLPERQRDLRQTIDSILSAAEAEFGEVGFDGVRMQDIARRARFSRQTLYTYFADKGSLFQEVYRRVSKRHGQILLGQNFADMAPVDALNVYVDRIFEINLDHRGFLTIGAWHCGADLALGHLTPDITKRAIATLDGVLSRGKAEGLFRDDAEAETIFCRAMAVCVGSIASAGMMTHVFASDYDSPEALDRWRVFCRESVLAQVVRDRRG